MNNVDYDKRKFTVDGYGNLYPKTGNKTPNRRKKSGTKRKSRAG